MERDPISWVVFTLYGLCVFVGGFVWCLAAETGDDTVAALITEFVGGLSMFFGTLGIFASTRQEDER